MLDVESSELLGSYCREVAMLVRPGWDRIVIYKEYLREPDGFLRNRAMEKVLLPGGVVEELPVSAESVMALDHFYEYCETTGKTWKGMRLVVFPEGRFEAAYFYDINPLMSRDYDEARRRMAGGEA